MKSCPECDSVIANMLENALRKAACPRCRRALVLDDGAQTPIEVTPRPAPPGPPFVPWQSAPWPALTNTRAARAQESRR